MASTAVEIPEKMAGTIARCSNPEREQLREVENLHRFLEGHTAVLEIGCGTGYLTTRLARHGVSDLVAVDTNPIMVRLVSEKLAQEGIEGVEVHEVTESTPVIDSLKGRRFSHAVIGITYHHLANRIDYLRGLREVADKLIILDWNKTFPEWWWMGQPPPPSISPKLTLAEAAKEVEEAGWQVTHSEDLNKWQWVIVAQTV
eukprot:Sspe_Gene.65816::Locus_38910_Transcript_2_3_Confidence_0.500_Length_861::g.65816::m.65816